jgi:2,3-bisphosphoglycerate-dependent phosphoglycerate mutase
VAAQRSSATGRLVLVRHGESDGNAANRFGGWIDVDLTARGVEEARQAGRLLRRHGWRFDAAHTSLLRRAQQTLQHMLEELDLAGLPASASWLLNERHYGALQGLDRAEAAQRFGEQQVRLWRRSLDARPPELAAAQAAALQADPRYAGVPLIRAESLRDTVHRIAPFWTASLVPALRAGQDLLVVAHGNSIRALMVHIERLSDEAFPDGEIPRATPRIYQFAADLKVLAKDTLEA